MGFIDGIADFINKHKPEQLARFVMPYLTFLMTVTFLLLLINYNNRADDAEQFTEGLREGLISACQDNGTPLRNAMQKILQKDIEESQSLTSAQLKDFFPSVPPETIEKLVAEEIAKTKALLAKIPDIDCEAAYPKPPE